MTVSGTAIDRKTADGAREDLEQHNQDLIAKCKAEGSSPIVRLEVGQTLARLYSACEDFAKAYEQDNPTTTIKWRPPVLCTRPRPPRLEPITMNEVYGCLALGKIGGEEAAELKTGHAFVWESGEKHEFGDADAVYIGFKVDEESK